MLMLAARAVVRALELSRIERRDPHTSKVVFGLCNWLRRHGLQQQRRRRTGCCLATRLWLDEFETWRGLENHQQLRNGPLHASPQGLTAARLVGGAPSRVAHPVRLVVRALTTCPVHTVTPFTHYDVPRLTTWRGRCKILCCKGAVGRAGPTACRC